MPRFAYARQVCSVILFPMTGLLAVGLTAVSARVFPINLVTGGFAANKKAPPIVSILSTENSAMREVENIGIGSNSFDGYDQFIVFILRFERFFECIRYFKSEAFSCANHRSTRSLSYDLKFSFSDQDTDLIWIKEKIQSWSPAGISKRYSYSILPVWIAHSNCASKPEVVQGHIGSLLNSKFIWSSLECLVRNARSRLGSNGRLLSGIEDAIRKYCVERENHKRKEVYPKYAALKLVGLALFGVVALSFFCAKVYFCADPFEVAGWLWFLAFLFSFAFLVFAINALWQYCAHNS